MHRSNIATIRDFWGDMVTKDSQIAVAFREFYASLYARDTTTQKEGEIYLSQAAVTPINSSGAEVLDAPIRIEEVIGAISRLKLLKSLGPDGFSAGFYKSLCPQLAPILTRLFNSFQGPGSIPPDMLAADIIVLPKPGKDTTQCASYRPISLLNLVLKLFHIISYIISSIYRAHVHPGVSWRYLLRWSHIANSTHMPWKKARFSTAS